MRHVQLALDASERGACKALGQPRSTERYDERVDAEEHELVRKHPRYGYRTDVRYAPTMRWGAILIAGLVGVACDAPQHASITKEPALNQEPTVDAGGSGSTVQAEPSEGCDVQLIVLDLDHWDSASRAERHGAATSIGGELSAFDFLRLERFESGRVMHEVAVFRHDVTGLEFSLVPGGRALLGAPDCADWVSFRHPFLISRTEMTRGAWSRVMGESAAFPGGPDFSHDGLGSGDRPTVRHPVERVSWPVAVEFCNRVGLELPSEAQWEYACRAGSRGEWCFGNDRSKLSTYAWAEPHTNRHRSAEVAQLRPNAFGLFDVHGNVQEICADRPRAAGTPLSEEPNREGAPLLRVARGGHVNYASVSCSAAASVAKDRHRISGQTHTGFRPALTLRFLR